MSVLELEAAREAIRLLVERAEEAEAEVARLKVFVSRHTDGSCTNPLCDCVEAKLHRAQATIERVRAVHRAFLLYDKCDHGHQAEGGDVVNIDEIGLTCAKYLRLIGETP